MLASVTRSNALALRTNYDVSKAWRYDVCREAERRGIKAKKQEDKTKPTAQTTIEWRRTFSADDFATVYLSSNGERRGSERRRGENNNGAQPRRRAVTGFKAPLFTSHATIASKRFHRFNTTGRNE